MRATVGPDGLSLRGVTVEASEGDGPPLRILDIPSLEVPPGAQLALTGPSGSGKTTLLHLLAGLSLPTRGEVRWGDLRIDALSERARDRWRGQTVGLVFQDFNLIPELDALGNVLLPLTFSHLRPPATHVARARALLERVGIEIPSRRVSLMSRGEQQRVAIVRALVHEPRLLIADEPTASLDAGTAKDVVSLLVGAAAERGATLLIASHDPAVAGAMRSVHRIDRGRVVSAGALSEARA